MVLRDLHDRIDAAVAAAYGWPADLPAAEIVARVVALDKERRAEEAEGRVRWLRPGFQAPQEVRRQAAQAALDVGEAAADHARIKSGHDGAGRAGVQARTRPDVALVRAAVL